MSKFLFLFRISTLTPSLCWGLPSLVSPEDLVGRVFLAMLDIVNILV